MKLRYLIYVLCFSLGFVLAGCVDDSYPGTIDLDVEVDDSTPQPVWMSIGRNSNDFALRGTGTLDDIIEFQEKEVYVYAFSKEANMSFSTLGTENKLICLVDATLDEPASKLGRKAYLDNKTGYLQWVSGAEPIYYPHGDNSGLIYNFFAFYLDDLKVTNNDIHRNDDNIVIDVEIDGSNDLMSSKAMPTEKQLERLEEDDRILAMYRSYSYMTARKHGIQPNFIFKHHLVKLDFNFVSGYTPGQVKEVLVEKVEVVSKYKGEFVVADKRVESDLRVDFNPDLKKNLVLTESDGSPFVPFIVYTGGDKDEIGEGIRPGGSLLVADDTEYEIIVTMSERKIADGVSYTNSKKVSLSKGRFEPGNEYLITLHVFGMMDIKVTAELGDWNYGGGVDYDEEFRPNH